MVRVGDEFGWSSVSGKPHYGVVSDIDSNVIYIRCRYCKKECCTEGQPEDFQVEALTGGREK